MACILNALKIRQQLNKNKYIFIDGLRGVAALLVVIFHQQLSFISSESPISKYSTPWWFILGFFDLGKFAVVIFFMVSGFLIPSTLRAPNSSVAIFATHRFFRLYPAYWFSIVFFFLSCYFLKIDTKFTIDIILLNLTMLQNFFGKVNILGVYWTLAIELIFYFCCAFLFTFRLLSQNFLIILCLFFMGLAIALLRFFTGKELPVAIFLALIVMFLGDIFRQYDEGQCSKAEVKKCFIMVLACIVPIIFFAYQEFFLCYLLTYYFAIFAFYFAFIYADNFSASQNTRLLSNFFGGMSYSVYLTGPVLQVVIFELYYKDHGNKYIATALFLVSVVMISLIIFRFIEEPCMRLGKYFSKKLKSLKQ